MNIGGLLGVAIIAYAALGSQRVNPRFFEVDEFRGWYNKMNPELLIKLDMFREMWGAPVIISPNPEAIGRVVNDPNASGYDSQHNIVKHGMVNAIDVFPSGMTNATERRRAFEIAKRVGFTGIGVYVDTQPQNMLHLDVRKNPSDGLDKWGRVAKNTYVNIERVLV